MRVVAAIVLWIGGSIGVMVGQANGLAGFPLLVAGGVVIVGPIWILTHGFKDQHYGTGFWDDPGM